MSDQENEIAKLQEMLAVSRRDLAEAVTQIDRLRHGKTIERGGALAVELFNERDRAKLQVLKGLVSAHVEGAKPWDDFANAVLDALHYLVRTD